MKRRRERWQRHQGRIDPKRLVFIDETWMKTNMAPLRGWAPKGDRLPGAAPFGHWNTSTFIAALRCDGIDAPWVFDGPVNGDIFRAYVERVLVPTLSPGDVVVMDNLGSHKSQAAILQDSGGEGAAVVSPGTSTSDRSGPLGPRGRGPTSRGIASAGPFVGARERGDEGGCGSPVRLQIRVWPPRGRGMRPPSGGGRIRISSTAEIRVHTVPETNYGRSEAELRPGESG